MNSHNTYLKPLMKALRLRADKNGIFFGHVHSFHFSAITASRNRITSNFSTSAHLLYPRSTSKHKEIKDSTDFSRSTPASKIDQNEPPLHETLSKQTLPPNLNFITPSKSTSIKAKHSDIDDKDDSDLLPIFKKRFNSNTQASQDKASRPAWQLRREAQKARPEGERWNPKIQISPDAMIILRNLNASNPEAFSIKVLSKEFGISYESVRRILKSRWRPNEAELERRREVWHKRGKEIWQAQADQGIKPPKKWRMEGVGQKREGIDLDGVPRWKDREWTRRNSWWEREVRGKVLSKDGLKHPPRRNVDKATENDSNSVENPTQNDSIDSIFRRT